MKFAPQAEPPGLENIDHINIFADDVFQLRHVLHQPVQCGTIGRAIVFVCKTEQKFDAVPACPVKIRLKLLQYIIADGGIVILCQITIRLCDGHAVRFVPRHRPMIGHMGEFLCGGRCFTDADLKAESPFRIPETVSAVRISRSETAECFSDLLL